MGAANLPPEQRKFYKYVSRPTAKIVLRDRTLRWSTPGTLNDPFDTQFDLHLSVDMEVVRRDAIARLKTAFEANNEPSLGNDIGQLLVVARSLRPKLTWEGFSKGFEEAILEGIERAARHLPELHREARNELATSKILCLSEVRDSLPMWSYYAESHQGAVLEFATIPALDSPYQVAQPVHYCAAMPLICDEQFLVSMFAGEVSFSAKDIIERTVFTKALEWRHEREWRIYSGDGRDRYAPHEDVSFHPRELTSVFFGCRMPEADQAELCRLLSRFPHVRVYRMTKSETAFAVDAIPLTSCVPQRPTAAVE